MANNLILAISFGFKLNSNPKHCNVSAMFLVTHGYVDPDDPQHMFSRWFASGLAHILMSLGGFQVGVAVQTKEYHFLCTLIVIG